MLGAMARHAALPLACSTLASCGEQPTDTPTGVDAGVPNLATATVNRWRRGQTSPARSGMMRRPPPSRTGRDSRSST